MSINYVLNCDRNTFIKNLSKKLSKFVKNLNSFEDEFSEYIFTLGKYINTEIKIYDFYFIKFVNIIITSNGKKIFFDATIQNKKITFFSEDEFTDIFFIEDNLKYKNVFINSIFLANKILFLNNELKTYAKIELEKSIVYIFTDNQNFHLIENDFEGNLIKSKKFKFNNIDKIEHLIIYLSNYLDMKEEFLNKLNEIGISKINKEFFKINDIINY